MPFIFISIDMYKGKPQGPKITVLNILETRTFLRKIPSYTIVKSKGNHFYK